jgi:hypothetical protein
MDRRTGTHRLKDRKTLSLAQYLICLTETPVTVTPGPNRTEYLFGRLAN